ncbi:MAG: glycosyltransferase [Bacteroidota bacterium]|nr:glycosyltransferase [Bacteroidota bacterium]
MILLMLPSIVVSFILGFHFFGYIISLFKVPKRRNINSTQNEDFACIITAYKSIETTKELLHSLINQSYFSYHIYLVADRCHNLEFNSNRLTIIYPECPLDSKVKSIQLAVNKFVRKHTAVVVFDADNVAKNNFLHEINVCMQMGFDVVQGQRIAKNANTKIAQLDAIGEVYYNFNTREVPFRIGSSATIAGSGMAVKTKLFIEYLYSDQLQPTDHKVITAEDKILQNYVVNNGCIIAYAPEAILYDEKTETSGKIKRQRTRWFNAYFRQLGNSISLFQNASFNQFYFGILSSYPPIIVTIISAIVLLVLDIIFWIEGAIIIAVSMMIFVSYFLYSIYIKNHFGTIIHAINYLPVFMVNQLLGLFQIKKADKDFLATEHLTSHLNHIIT